MARKLVHLCVGLALLMGCWGGVLAAAACPHMGCKTEPAAPAHAAARGDHDAGGDHHTGVAADHSAHATGHQGHAAEPPAGEQLPPESDVVRGVGPGPHDPFCTHCSGRAEAPPSRSVQWQFNFVKQVGKVAAPQAAGQSLPATPVFVREITPAQHAPPGQADRRLLLNVFRI